MPDNTQPYCAYDMDHPRDRLTIVKDIPAHLVPKKFGTYQAEIVRQVPVPRFVTVQCGTCGRISDWQAPNDWQP
jgi:hypothetical protein